MAQKWDKEGLLWQHIFLPRKSSQLPNKLKESISKMLKLLNYFTKTMGINIVSEGNFMTMNKSIQLLSQRQMVTENPYVVTKNIGNTIGRGVSPQLTVWGNPKHNEWYTGSYKKYGTSVSIWIIWKFDWLKQP